jgi:CRP/FNR family transcriptional regulator, anaerobic regulatory protein
MANNTLFPTEIPRICEKGTILLREGEHAKYAYQAIKGCLKSYVLDEQGKEYIVQFTPED